MLESILKTLLLLIIIIKKFFTSTSSGTSFSIFFVFTTCVALCVQAQARLRLFGI